MSSKIQFVIFGGMGDLCMRKIFPALCRMQADNRLPDEFAITGVARKPIDDAQYKEIVQDNLFELGLDKRAISDLLDRVTYCCIDFEQKSDFSKLKDLLPSDALLIHYLAIHSNYFIPVCANMHSLQLLNNARVVLEKPIGSNRESARAIHTQLQQWLHEDQIFRIDHYLGKESVQNLFALRFGNTLFETLWNRNNIRCVEISIAEELGIGSRGGFYDGTGAMRDMVQGHVLQLLSITAMDIPLKMEANYVRDEKVKVLRALRPMSSEHEVRMNTIRGQYLGDDMHPGFLQAPNVSQSSSTETFVALKCWIDNWRWAGVPFYLRTGKRMQARLGQIIIHFNDVPHTLFSAKEDIGNVNQLIIGLNPNDQLDLQFVVKIPGDSTEVAPVKLNLDFSSYFNTRPRDAYERLIQDIVNGELTLFLRHDEVDASWMWADQIIEHWKGHEEEVYPYKAGSWGPSRRNDFIQRDGYIWLDSLIHNKQES